MIYTHVQKIYYLDEDGISRIKVPKIINTDVSWQLMFGSPQFRDKKKHSLKPIREEVVINLKEY